MRKIVFVLSVLAVFVLSGESGQATRLKDVASFSGVRSNQLVGYGLVVGLSGTGDKSGMSFTSQSIHNMLERMGVRVDKDDLKVKNVAAVMVTAKMPASAKPGTKIDVSVSSIGDAKSLLGGVLVQTPLKGVDGKIYGLAQGPLVVGGYSTDGEAASSTKNVPTVATIPNGAVVERKVSFEYNRQETVTVNMNVQDFSTTSQVVGKINSNFGEHTAKAEDVSTIKIEIPDSFKGNLVPFMAALENMQVSPENRARVVVDEKTGTVVIGQSVSISQVAIAHGNLDIVVQEEPQVSQPAPFSDGETVVVPRTDMEVVEDEKKLMMVDGATINELVEGLNRIGATPRDLISILKALKAAGALHAELEVI
ncbi:MAG: flagellar basal body P-ring protein FlgI [Desulfonatronovibrionaceae bacterium]